MRIGRTLPPAASPIPVLDIIQALFTCLLKESKEDLFKKELKQEFNVKHCFLLSSGKAALSVILFALKELYPSRNKVIIPAFTCYSVPAAVKRAGLKIELCDLAPSSLNLDKQILNKIIDNDLPKKQILCVLPTHLFGCPEDIEGIKAITGPDITIVEDAAQAMGENLSHRKLGTLGDIGFFSLGRGKALSTMEGGIIITDSDDLANILEPMLETLTDQNRPFIFIEILKAFFTTAFQHPQLFWLPKFLPFLKLGQTFYEPDFTISQYNKVHAALTRNWNKRLIQHQQVRNNHVLYWKSKLPPNFHACCSCLSSCSMIRFPILAQTKQQRDVILKQSDQQGLGLMPAYPTPVNKIPELENECLNVKLQIVENICNRLLTIPVHEYVTLKDNEQILSLLQNIKG